MLLTEQSRSVWENLDLGHVYRPHCIRSVLMTLVKLLPYRPRAGLISRAKSWARSWVQTECMRSAHDQDQDSPIQTDWARLIRCLVYGKQEQFNLLKVCSNWHFSCEWQWAKFNSCSSSLLSFIITLFGTCLNWYC